MLALVALSDAHLAGDQVRSHSDLATLVEIDHEIFSMVILSGILSLPLIQEGQLSVSDKSMYTGAG